jgi:hypothetical protein
MAELSKNVPGIGGTMPTNTGKGIIASPTSENETQNRTHPSEASMNPLSSISSFESEESRGFE